MANKRMFNMKIVDSDAFLDMPLSTQCLYFHLNMRADDDGFVGNPKKIMRIIGASEDDLKLLIAKRFILTFENGVIVIKHWRIHNTLSGGRYHETVYLDEKESLLLKENKSYSFSSGEKIDDSRLIEMYNPTSENKRRTNGEQTENADIEEVVVLDLDKDKGLDNNININKSKERSSSVTDPDTTFINIPVQGGQYFTVTYGYVDELKALYPDVDVEQALRSMVGWSNANSKKTMNGVKRFINNWLQKDQKESKTPMMKQGATAYRGRQNPMSAIREKILEEERRKGASG